MGVGTDIGTGPRGAPVAPPVAPGRLGEAIAQERLLDYLGRLTDWTTDRRAELDRLSRAAEQAADPGSYTSDVLLALTLWQAIDGRRAELVTVWDSGRVTAVERERMSQLIWGRLDSTNGAALVSLSEAIRLCEALVIQLRSRLSFDPQAANLTARVTEARAAIERCRDLVSTDRQALVEVDAMRARLDDLAARAARGADVTGPLGELEVRVARNERDYIVRLARRRELTRDVEIVRRTAADLAAKEPALRELAGRCRIEIAGAPRLAVPEVARLGEVPAERDALDSYSARLDQVKRAFDAVEEAYTAPLRERAELRFRLSGDRRRAQANGRIASPTVTSGWTEASAAVERTPCDLAMAKFLVEQFQYLTRPAPMPTRRTNGEA